MDSYDSLSNGTSFFRRSDRYHGIYNNSFGSNYAYSYSPFGQLPPKYAFTLREQIELLAYHHLDNQHTGKHLEDMPCPFLDRRSIAIGSGLLCNCSDEAAQNLA